jgi:hypothetical protein
VLLMRVSSRGASSPPEVESVMVMTSPLWPKLSRGTTAMGQGVASSYGAGPQKALLEPATVGGL